MSRNASGTYTLPSGNPVVSGTLIEASWANTTLSDLASAMTDSLSRTGQGGMQAALRLFDGTSSVPGLAWANETTSGWYRAGAGDMRLVVTGSEVVKYLATGVAVTGTMSASGNTTVGGTLGVTGAATFSSTLAVTGNATVGGTLAITGAVTLTANPTLSAGTANGVAYLNGSKVLTTGSALTFDGTKFTQTASTTGILSEFVNSSSANQNGNIVATNDGGTRVRLQVFGSAAGSYGMLSANSSVLYTSGADLNLVADNASGVIKFGLNGSSEQMRLTSTGLGIGTSSPGSFYSGARQLVVGSGSGEQGITVYAGSSSQSFLLFADGTAGGDAYRGQVVYDHSNNSMLFATNAGTRATLDSSGNLGLGVTPSAWGASVFSGVFEGKQGAFWAPYVGGPDLYTGVNAYYDTGWKYKVSSNAATYYRQTAGQHQWATAPSGTAGSAITWTQAMTLDASGILTLENDQLIRNGKGLAFYNSTNANYYSLYNSSGTLTFSNGTGRAFLDSSGNLGIGTSSPFSSNGTNIEVANSTVSRLVLNQTGTRRMSIGVGSNCLNIYDETANAERMRITADGYVLMGTTGTLGSGSARLSVEGGGGVVVGIKSTGGSGNECTWQWNNATTGNNLFTTFLTETTSTARGSISYNRGSGVVAYNTTSDYRAKDIIGEVQNALATVAQLKPWMGVMKGATVERPMFVAHEAQAVAPYAVVGEKDAVKEDGTPDFQQMDHSTLVPLLTAAIQELTARVQALEAK